MMQKKEPIEVLTYIKEEQETTIGFGSDKLEAIIYCCQAKRIRQLDKLCLSHPEYYKKTKENFYLVTDQKLIRFGTPRILSDEQKEKLKNRFKKG